MMQDKNGREIHAGDIVEISGAYFKNDNGFWYVEQDTTNEAYLAKESITLKKISKRGKVSRSKYNLAFYPLKSYVNDRAKAVVIRERRSYDFFTKEFDNKEEAKEWADYVWRHMSKSEKKHDTVYVLESENEDEEAPNHYDGNYVWKDGSVDNLNEIGII